MWLIIVHMWYNLYAIGETKKQAQERIVEAYTSFYPVEDRKLKNPTFKDIYNEYSCTICKIDPNKGFAVEGQ